VVIALVRENPTPKGAGFSRTRAINGLLKRPSEFYEAESEQNLWEIKRFVELSNAILSRGMTHQKSSDK